MTPRKSCTDLHVWDPLRDIVRDPSRVMSSFEAFFTRAIALRELDEGRFDALTDELAVVLY